MKRTFLQILSEIQDSDELHRAEHEETGFWGKSGAGGLFMARDTGRILIPFRSRHVLEPHTWGTWGGAIDPGEKPQEAAAREAYEEAGYSPKPGDIIPLYVFDSGTGFRYFNYLILVPNEFTPLPYEGPDSFFDNPPGNWETESHVWTEFGNWPSPMHPGLKSLLSDPKSIKMIQELSERFGAPAGNTQQTTQAQNLQNPQNIPGETPTG